MYDWANSALWTTVITAVFPVYFQRVVANGAMEKSEATQAYAAATTIAVGLVALIGPPLGALADCRPWKKRMLAAFQAVAVAATAGLFFVGRGDVAAALILFGLANVGAAGALMFYDSLLPHVARPDELDRVSTAGYALGYVGGGLMLALDLAWIQFPGAFGLPSGEGLSESDATLPARLSFLAVAVWWTVFSIPMYRRVAEPPVALEPDEAPGASAVSIAFSRCAETLRELRRYRDAFVLMIAFLLYNDGVLTIIRMAAGYGSNMGLSQGTLIGAIVAVQFVGIPCAFAFGALARRFGPRACILGALSVYLVVTFLAWRMSTEWHFWALALLVALVQGGVQALSRSLFASMVPRHKSSEFFGIFGVCEKFAGIAGPALFAVTIGLTGSERTAILTVLPFFAVGAWLLTRVDIGRGREVARAADETTRVSAT